MSPRAIFCLLAFLICGGLGVATYFWTPAAFAFLLVGPVVLLGVRDLFDKRHAVLHNFPVIGHFRYLLEEIRPEIQQYFIETNTGGMPFSRETRSLVYQRAKKVLDTVPFGTQREVNEIGYEWINHSIAPVETPSEEPRIQVGGKHCKQPYSASVLNISAMSYGSLSSNAVLALNLGAKLGNFYHNTGEGGISSFHLQHQGDLVWQVGTGYFGCRTKQGDFNPEGFRERATLPSVKMIEVKLSQGAKPGHGGILPGAKVSAEIAKIRDVEIGKTVYSPPYHRAFKTPIQMMEFIQKLRELSGGKPVGFKLCIGKRREFLAICKAMLETGIAPDFITVDGSEGGTGAAPLEFSNSIGTPLNDGLVFVHNALTGIGLRDQVRVIASGKITTGFHIAAKISLGADICNSARGMMFALGCIQALRCNYNNCPTGVATQNPSLTKGLDPTFKGHRVLNFHHATVHSFLEVIAAGGMSRSSELRPWKIHRRVEPTVVKHYGELYEYIESGSLLKEPFPQSYVRAWKAADARTFN